MGDSGSGSHDSPEVCGWQLAPSAPHTPATRSFGSATSGMQVMQVTRRLCCRFPSEGGAANTALSCKGLCETNRLEETKEQRLSSASWGVSCALQGRRLRVASLRRRSYGGGEATGIRQHVWSGQGKTAPYHGEGRATFLGWNLEETMRERGRMNDDFN